MSLRTRLAAASAAAALVVTGAAVAAPMSSAAPAAPAATQGAKPLAAVLTANGGGTFDTNWADFDIVTQAVLAVLKAKPESDVKVLTDGSVALTAFIPTDKAFQRLVTSLTGKTPANERATFRAVAGLGIPTVEAVLLYHVVPGATIRSGQALKANGASLATAAGATVKVGVTKAPQIILRDKDTDSRNARVILSLVDINKGNKQIAHGINLVLRPIDLKN
jgi:uncharacterized surface protein with fasciclin (FAS1) repeats